MSRKHSKLALVLAVLATLVIGLMAMPRAAHAQDTVYKVTFSNPDDSTKTSVWDMRTAQDGKLSFTSEEALSMIQSIETSIETWNSVYSFISLDVSPTSGKLRIKGSNIDGKTIVQSVNYSIESKTLHDVNVACDPGQGSTASANPTRAAKGDQVSISVTPANGYEFDEWTSAVGVTFANKNATSTTFTMPDKDVTVTAKLKPATYNITVNGGSANSTSAAYGSTVQINAADPSPAGMGFVEWTGPDEVAFASKDAASTTFTMPAQDVELTAVWKRILIDGVTPAEFVYEGKAIEPSFPNLQVNLEGTDLALVRDKDYTVKYSDNVHAGTASLIVTLGDARTGSNSATFQITERPLTVTASSDTKEYDGTALTATYTSEGLAEGDSIDSVTVEGSQTDVGECESTVESVTITNADGSDSTNDYDITYVPGKLEVTPYTGKVTVTITGHTDTVGYDGKEHEVSGYDISSDVDFYDMSNVEFSGTATAKGTKAGTYPMRLSASDFSNTSDNFTNVVFEVEDGSLTIEEEPVTNATLTFNLNGGTLDGKTGKVTVKAKVGTTVKLPKAPTRDGYTFKCWKGSEYAAEADYQVEGDHTFTAEWTKKEPATTYTISFDANGGKGEMASVSVKAGSSATLAANKFTRSGYTFTGWNTRTDGKGTAYKDKATVKPKGDMKLYAQWKKSATGSSRRTTSSRSATPKTGDPTSYMPAAAVAVAGAALVAVAVRRRQQQ